MTTADASPMRVFVDPPAAGDWNMAVDEMLLEAAAEQEVATLRFYQWTPATLSLGYFQAAAERDKHLPSRRCPLVRRASGGGALVHDHELTYSLSLPTPHPSAVDPETLYRRVHGLIIAVLADFGVVARMNERTFVTLGGEPFLCFRRRAVGDLLIGEHKICGSAQRRRRGAILQHGGILLARSDAAPELPGIAELTSRQITADEFARHWIERRFQDVGELLPVSSYSPVEQARIEAFRREKYADAAWTNRR